jgi:hypothetical protein
MVTGVSDDFMHLVHGKEGILPGPRYLEAYHLEYIDTTIRSQ